MKYNSEIVEAYKKICNNGLVINSWGNVCASDGSKVWITPSGVKAKDLDVFSIVEVDLHGNKTHKNKFNPSVDTKIHTELYRHFRQNDGMKSVIHTHSKYATIFAQAKSDIPCLGTTHSDYFYGDIPCVDELNDDEIHNDFEKNSGKSIIKYFEKYELNPNQIKAALLPSHGVMIWGSSINEAIDNAIVLEHIAELCYHTLNLNKNVIMNEKLIDKHFLRKHGEEKYYGQ